MRIKFDESCLKKAAFTHKKAVNTHIVYEIKLQPFTVGQDFTQEILYLEPLSWLKIMILMNINILAILLDLMPAEVFRFIMVVGLVKL